MTQRWRDIPHSWIRRINIVKMTILTENNLQIQRNSYQITNGIFHRTFELIKKFVLIFPYDCMKKPKQTFWPTQQKNFVNNLHGNMKDSEKDFPGGPMVKNPPVKAGDTGSIPGQERFHVPQSN